MQMIWKCPLTDEEYVTQRAWEGAILDICPFHPEGGCGLVRHGSYGRVEPEGVRVPRWWCPLQGESISLLPWFLAARMRGTLAAVEHVVATVEAVGVSAAVDVLHPPDAEQPIGLAGALRSIRRRVRSVRAVLLAIATLLPERFTGVAHTLAGFRKALALSDGGVLVRLRKLAERFLGSLPAPLGLRARGSG